MVTLVALQGQYDNMLPYDDDYDDARVEQIVDDYLTEWSAADLLEILSGNILRGAEEALEREAIKQCKQEAAEAQAEYEYNLKTWDE
ncbi:Uncharacterised protein [Neisseria subflava]|uniref:Uncharacterized protein n=1 Tax=Neisseria subflava TaxID=28449 RepID=A0A9X9QZK6_NEISU|nr:hypothetical protein [Neisseria subflava]VTY10059.1 Uncharacterised protein [Neisseria subflava]